jgi:sulfatase modifying factor 1
MNPRRLSLLFAGLWFPASLLVAHAQGTPAIFPDEDPQTPADYRLVWPATPGHRYEIRQSTDLKAWTGAPGFPATADGPAQQLPFTAGNTPLFFQVVPLDEQPPAIANQFPADGGFAVRRTSSLTVELTDTTGVDPASLQLTIGNLAPVTTADPRLTFTNGVLTFAGGDSTPLGTFGATVPATLIAADVLGNRGTNTWSFTLELEPQVVANLFVFGSPQAQASGQRLGDIPTAALARRLGPVRQNAGVPWVLESVQPDRLVLAYTQATPPAFATGTYVCNLTPANPDQIFYRRVTSVSDDAADKRLTLFTVDVPLAEVLKEASISLSAESVIYELSTGNELTQPRSFSPTFDLPVLGADVGGRTVVDLGGVTLKLNEARFLFTSSLSLSLETRALSLQRFSAEFRGNLETALVPELTIRAQDLEDTFQRELFSRRRVVYLGLVGAVPVWLDLNFSLGAEFGFHLSGIATMTTGVRQDADLSFALDYVKDRSPKVTVTPRVIRYPAETVPFTYAINGSGTAQVTLTPQLDLRINSLAGVQANVDPQVAIDGQAAVSNGQVTSANWTIVADADLNVGLSVVGLDSGELPGLPPINLFRKEWSVVYPPPGEITIRTQPADQTAVLGGVASFFVDAISTQPLAYQWHFNGVPLAGQISSSLDLNRVKAGHAGSYHVRLTGGRQTVNSATATLTVRASPPPAPAGMVLIPAGPFQMGDTFNDSPDSWRERPVHSVFFSAFYMDKFEVTKTLWNEVYTWALAHGYGFDRPGLGKAANHPVYSINWYDMVKWCNARSEKAGLTPCYYTAANQSTVYRSGNVNLANDAVKWGANGHRLPTEAEWEKAARGGLQGKRFPWGDTTTHSQANYYSDANYAYDVSPTRGPHPTYAVGGFPYTSPVGSFAANGYGLFDMAGNVEEWCWDWHGLYPSGSQTDPHGPTSGSAHVLRGGDWANHVGFLRCASRLDFNDFPPTGSAYLIGFRCVRGL